MANKLFVCTYNDQEAFNISKQKGVLGFSTKNSGTVGTLGRLRKGYLVLLRDSRIKDGLGFFGLLEVLDTVYEADETFPLIWQQEIQQERVVFKHRVPVEFIKNISSVIPKDKILSLDWQRRQPPFTKYDWTGYSRLFAGNILEDEQTNALFSLLNLELFPEFTPRASDIEINLPEKILTYEYRVLRDTNLARQIKEIHNFVCQICGVDPIKLPNGNLYAEAHHLKPLGKHRGPDISSNIICVCPTCHVKLDYGVIEVDKSRLQIYSTHDIWSEFIDYHNMIIHKAVT